MNVPTRKLLVPTVLVLGATSLMLIIDPCPPEADELPRPPLEHVLRGLPEILTLRIDAKDRIAKQVIAGQLSLIQAAALFGALNRLSPQSVEPPRSDLHASRLGFPAHTDDERLCQQVVLWVDAELAEATDVREATLLRLKAEFQEELRKEGRVRLPDPLTLVSVQELLGRAQSELAFKGVLLPKKGLPEERVAEH